MTLLTSTVDSLSAPAIFGWLMVSLVAGYVASAFWSWYRLCHIPGPRLASFSYLWIGLNIFRGTTYQAYQGLKKYGPLVRNGPNYLVTDDPDVIRAMAGARSRYTRDHWYKGAKFHPDKDNMGSTIDTKAHDLIKAKVASGYSGRENPDLEVAIDSQVCRLVDLIRRKHISTGDDLHSVDFCLLSRYFTLDVITRLGYGNAFGYLDEGVDLYEWVWHVDHVVTVMTLTLDIPWIRHVFYSSLGLRLFGPKPTDKRGFGRVMGYVLRTSLWLTRTNSSCCECYRLTQIPEGWPTV